MKQDYVTLNNGAKMPLVGLGTWQAKDEKELTAALKVALDCGYRLIDTAFMYMNEAIIGKVLHEYFSTGKLRREDVFITTKLPITGHAPEVVPQAVDAQLKALQIDYIDLYLIHTPLPFKKSSDSFVPVTVDDKLVPDVIDHLDTWKALEKLQKSGKLKAIGLSNFTAKAIQRIYDNAEVKPANLQVEAHIYWPQHELHELCKKLNISFTAYAPIGSPGRRAARPNGEWPEGDPLSEPVVAEIAQKHHKTPAQILLRQLMQRNIAVIPKSTNSDRIKQNFDVFNFKLTDDEMHKLDSVPTRTRLFIFDMGKHHPMYQEQYQD